MNYLLSKEKRTPSLNLLLQNISYIFIIAFSLLAYNTTKAQIVINEIQGDGTVELKNIGTSVENVSTYWLCNFPAYTQISSMNVVCGSMNIPAGEFLTVSGFDINNTDAELGLYISDLFGDSNSIIDYVEWGSSGHVRSSLAASAGIWTIGDFVPSFGMNETLAYNGMGDTSSSWTTGNSSLCSENIEVTSCDAEGGIIALDNGETATSICVDGNGDPLEIVFSSAANGSSQSWIITDLQNNILGLPMAPPFDLDGAGIGTCLIWAISYESDFDGAVVGNNVSDLTGCFDLSNEITVYREAAHGGTVSLTNNETTYTGTAGNIVFDVQHQNDAPHLNYWYIITDNNDNILGWLNSAEANTLDLSAAPAGECHIWGWSYNDLGDPIMGEHITSLDDDDCEAISINWLTIIREGDACDVEGGTLSGGPFEFTVGDGTADMIPEGAITLANSQGANSQWIVTDDEGYILGLPPMPSVVDFDGAGAGTCLIWHLSYNGEIAGLEAGLNANNITGCASLSDAVEVIRSTGDDCNVNGGKLFGGPFEFTVGDGTADMIPEGAITLANSQGANSQWIVTDDEGYILGLPPMPSVVDFDGAGAGTCLIWHLSYDGEIAGLEAGLNANDITGCASLSDAVQIIRNSDGDCQANGGKLFGGPFEFTVGDGTADMIPEGAITLANSQGANSQWIVTDDEGYILGLPPMPSVVDFDGAGAGTCLIWHLSYDGEISGLEAGLNANDITGCASLSDAVEVIRNAGDDCNVNGGDIGTTNYRTVVANRASGTISVINATYNEIIGTYDMPENGEPMYVVHNNTNNTVLVGDYNGKVVAFDGNDFSVVGSVNAGDGVFHMWISPNGQQLWVNNELDKSISVVNPSTLEHITTFSIPSDLLESGFKPHDVIVMPDNSAAFVTMLGSEEQDYVVKYDATTFEEIARTAVGPDPHVSLTAANDYLYVASQGSSEVNVLNRSDLTEVTSISIPNAHGLGMNNDGTYLYVGNISEGGSDATYTIDLATNTLVGEGVDAPFSAPHNYAISNNNSKLFITHSGATNNTVSVYDLSPTPSLITSLTVGNNPFGLASYSYQEAQAEFTFCVGDGIADHIEENAIGLSGNSGTNAQWLVTDEQGNILGLPPMPSAVNFDDAPAGTCLIWHLSYEDGIVGLEAGANANNLEGCFSLSNPITVNRISGGDCGTTGTDGVDLNLDLQADNLLYDQFTTVDYTFTVTNEGTETATNIEVDVTFPNGLVYTAHNTNNGIYDLYFQNWIIPSLAAGETASLNLTLFTLVTNQDITYFTQVVSLDQVDTDSTPDSSSGTVTEDDEAAVTITPKSRGGIGTGIGSNDLELSITADKMTYDIYENIKYTISITNNGSETATGIVVNAGLPEGMAYTSSNVNNGEYILYFEKWMIDILGAGETATLELELFTLVSNQAITNFVQIFVSNESDPDSTPGNNTTGIPSEDDEASITIQYDVNAQLQQANNLAFNALNAKEINIKNAYPNPAIDFIMLPIESDFAFDTTIRVMDAYGKIVKTEQVGIVKGKNVVNIDLDNFGPGVYFITLNNLNGVNTKQISKRFIKVNN